MRTFVLAILFLLVAACGQSIDQQQTDTSAEHVAELIPEPAEEPEYKNESLKEDVKKKILTEERIKAVEFPQRIAESCFGFLTGVPQELEMVKELDMKWTRPHTGPFLWDRIEPEPGVFSFQETDRWVREAQKQGVAIVGTIWPYAQWDQDNCSNQECKVSSQDQFLFELPDKRCAPCNMKAYQQFISKLVERYDGDGIDDMEGLTLPILYWEVLNEPEMNDDMLTFYKGSHEEYVSILRETYLTINKTCERCTVLQGGAAGIEDFMLDYWRTLFSLGAADYFDIANIHYIGFGNVANLNVKRFKALMKEHKITKPIWVTEAEYTQESEVLDSVKGALAAGAEKIFFTRFVVGYHGPPQPGEYSEVYNSIHTLCET